MAKKKKPAANPARGFATTSVASKPKPEKAVDASTDVSGTATPATPATVPTSVASEEQQASGPEKTKERELHELSPEELERQLETSELQGLVEAQGPKARKESARQISRLQTDRRVFRGQADALAVKEWLPEELMQQILDLVLDEEENASSSDKTRSLKNYSEDDMLSRIWQLHLTLTDLGIEPHRVLETLQYMLAHPPADNSYVAWGLSEALEWLALHAESAELGEYDAPKRRIQQNRPGKYFLTHFSFAFLPFVQISDRIRISGFSTGT